MTTEKAPCFRANLGVFLDPVERIFARAPVHRKNRFLGGKIDPVVAPFAAGDLAAIEIENFAQFVPVKRNNRHARRSRGDRGDWSGKALACPGKRGSSARLSSAGSVSLMTVASKLYLNLYRRLKMPGRQAFF